MLVWTSIDPLNFCLFFRIAWWEVCPLFRRLWHVNNVVVYLISVTFENLREFVSSSLSTRRLMCGSFSHAQNKPVLKQWIAFKSRSDWLVKLRISVAIYLRATREKMASRFTSVTSEEITLMNFLWCILSHCYSIYVRGAANIHHQPPPLRWIVVKCFYSCFDLTFSGENIVAGCHFVIEMRFHS